MNTDIVSTQLSGLASTLNMQNVDHAHMKQMLVNTVFKGANDEQLVTLLIVSNQYKLNPFTKEIYAFPAKGGGITPIVSIDGWLRIINDNPQHDGLDFEQDNESCTCKIYRKDRKHPTVVTEYMDECNRGTDPWKKYPKRMLRHKALIQCARVAYGYSGIYDEDEAQRIDNPDQLEPVNQPVDEAYASYRDEQFTHLDDIASTKGTNALQLAFQELPPSDYKKQFWTEWGATLKQTAQECDSQEIIDVEPIPA